MYIACQRELDTKPRCDREGWNNKRRYTETVFRTQGRSRAHSTVAMNVSRLLCVYARHHEDGKFKNGTKRYAYTMLTLEERVSRYCSKRSFNGCDGTTYVGCSYEGQHRWYRRWSSIGWGSEMRQRRRRECSKCAYLD
jgi:hypothetical protein